MTEFRDLLKQARLPERTVPVCLRGDLVADFEAAERELEAELLKPDTSSLDGGFRQMLRERIEAIQAEMRGFTWQFRLRALRRFEFQQLFDAHPAREGDDGKPIGKDIIGCNSDTFFPALIRACLVDPEVDADELTDLLENKLTDRQFNEIAAAAWEVNRGQVDVPFSRAASAMTPSSGGG